MVRQQSTVYFKYYLFLCIADNNAGRPVLSQGVENLSSNNECHLLVVDHLTCVPERALTVDGHCKIHQLILLMGRYNVLTHVTKGLLQYRSRVVLQM